MFFECLDERRLQTIDPICLSIWCEAKIYKKLTKYECDENGYKRPKKVRLKYNLNFSNLNQSNIFTEKEMLERTRKIQKESFLISYFYENNKEIIKEIKFVAESEDSIMSLNNFYDSFIKFQDDFMKSHTYKLHIK